MGISEEKMRQILGKDIHVSELTDNRLQDTYRMLMNQSADERKKSCYKKSYKKNLRTAAAVAAILCFAIPGVVYASVKSGFFEGMFGNETKKSTGVIHREIDDGKGNKVAVDIPSKEYVPVDEEKAETMIGQWVMDEPITRKIGEHTLTINSFAYDKNGALMYFTLEREGGVTALTGDMDTNLTKGAYFTEDADFYFCVESATGVTGAENIYIDIEKSTEEKLYCSSYILWPEHLNDNDTVQLVINQYPGPSRELDGAATKEEERTWWEQTQTEKIALTDKGQIPVRCIDLGDDGYIEYSPVSILIDMSKGLGLSEEEAGDPYYMKHLEIRYQDGSSYVVSDDAENINNSGYVLGTDEGYKAAFNRLVEPEQIAEIIVNEVSFPVQ